MQPSSSQDPDSNRLLGGGSVAVIGSLMELSSQGLTVLDAAFKLLLLACSWSYVLTAVTTAAWPRPPLGLTTAMICRSTGV